MAKVVDGLPARARGGGRPCKYPWQEWFDGRAWALRRGVDFDYDARDFRRTAHARAGQIGVRVRTRVAGDVVYVQAVKRDA